MNRVGDCGFILAILLIFFSFRSVDFQVVFSCIPFFAKDCLILSGYVEIITAICLFLFLGSIGKSAQIGLHT